MKRLSRIYIAKTQDGIQSFWQLTDKTKITLPEYIEGKAKKTIWEHPSGSIYRRIDEKVET
jgi:hypothetical protein